MRYRDANAFVDYRISHESIYDVKSSMSKKKIYSKYNDLD